MQYQAVAVANAFLDMARAEGRALDPMQLQKLVYFAHGWHLGLTGDPLILEPIEAWDYGPVIRTLYQELKTYGSGKVSGMIGDLRSEPPNVWDQATKDFLHKVWEVYGKLSAVELSAMTHRPNTPWTNARRLPFKNARIPDSGMHEYFSDLASRNAGTPGTAATAI